MFGISGVELLLILVFAFLILGPDKLPEMAKTAGKAIARFRDAQKDMNEVLKENDLVDSKLIVLDQIRNTTQYEATLDGEKTLEYFSYMISNDIKAEIDAYMRENAFELRNESSTRADYRQTGNGDYAVTCTVKEGNESLIDLTFTVPMEEEAERVCSKWPEKSQEIYMYIMEKLL